MSHLFATALLLALGAGSAGLLSLVSGFGIPGRSPFAPPSAFEVALAQPTGSLRAIPLTQAESVAPWAEIGQVSGVIAADICVDLPTWQRPSEIAQTKQLASMARYGTGSEDDPLADLIKAWWNHSIFSFTTYGLSARTDPLYLSGVWTALDSTWDCYSDDQGERLNQGVLAELWLLQHRLVSLVWEGGQYQLTVEPVATGLQMVQFPRQEQGEGLPLTVVTTTGQTLAVMSGDW